MDHDDKLAFEQAEPFGERRIRHTPDALHFDEVIAAAQGAQLRQAAVARGVWRRRRGRRAWCRGLRSRACRRRVRPGRALRPDANGRSIVGRLRPVRRQVRDSSLWLESLTFRLPSPSGMSRRNECARARTSTRSAWKGVLINRIPQLISYPTAAGTIWSCKPATHPIGTPNPIWIIGRGRHTNRSRKRGGRAQLVNGVSSSIRSALPATMTASTSMAPRFSTKRW